MARDLSAEIDHLTAELNRLRKQAARTTSHAADDAAGYIAPLLRQFSRQAQDEGQHLVDVARRHPGATGGAVIGAFALGALACWFLSSAGSSRN